MTPHSPATKHTHRENPVSDEPKKTIHFSPPIQQAVKELGYTEWTPIQEMTIPLIQEGNDVIGQSHTGSGKTAAFGLPIIEKVVSHGRVQALILVPTRELAEQVTQEMRKFAKHKRLSITSVYGGVAMGPQISHLRRTDIVVGTPGRVLDHLDRGTFNPNSVTILVLDEADRMFDMGFIRDMKKIIQRIPHHRQTLLFSATMPPEVHEIAKQYMKNPQLVKAQSYVDKGKLTHAYYDLDKHAHQKFGLLAHLIKEEKPRLAIVFCATRRMVDKVERALNTHGIPAQAIHGGLSQNQRKRTLDAFHEGRFHVLVASDVAARGLDIKNVSHIFNYDIPRNASEYIHRSGRTARAGEEGKMISLLAPQDYDDFRQVLRDKSLDIVNVPLPAFVPIEIMLKKGLTTPHGHGFSAARSPHPGYGGHRGGRPERREHGRPPHEGGRRFFPRKNKNEGRPSPGGRSLFSNRDHSQPGRGPDSTPRRGKPSGFSKPDKPIVKHFAKKHAPQDD